MSITIDRFHAVRMPRHKTVPCDTCESIIGNGVSYWNVQDTRIEKFWFPNFFVCVKCAPTEEEAQARAYVHYTIDDV